MEAGHQELDLELSLLRHALATEPAELGFFRCTYCDRKFYSSQALGGHQNAHKYERTLARRRREIAAATRNHGASSASVDAALIRPLDVARLAGADDDEPRARPMGSQQAVVLTPDPSSSPGLLPRNGSSSAYHLGRADWLDLSLRL